MGLGKFFSIFFTFIIKFVVMWALINFNFGMVRFFLVNFVFVVTRVCVILFFWRTIEYIFVSILRVDAFLNICSSNERIGC